MTARIEVPSPVGWLAVEARGGRVNALRFERRGGAATEPVLATAALQLEEYFSGRRRSFELPLSPPETSFDRAVLAAVDEIPYGERTTYGDVTKRLGLGIEEVRRVAAAIGRNSLPILVPCHRVIGADGSLTGYGGGLERKAQLLALEADQLQLVPV